MYWLNKNFKEYCHTKNIQLLRDDFRFIEKELIKLPLELHRTIMRDYSEKWLQGIKEESNALLKQNSGRKKANIWLREQAVQLKRPR